MSELKKGSNWKEATGLLFDCAVTVKCRVNSSTKNEIVWMKYRNKVTLKTVPITPVHWITSSDTECCLITCNPIAVLIHRFKY